MESSKDSAYQLSIASLGVAVSLLHLILAIYFITMDNSYSLIYIS